MPFRTRVMPLAAAALLALPAMAQAAVTTDTGCDALVRQYDEAIRTADGLISDMVDQALKSSNPSGVLQQLRLGGQGVSPDEAVRRGALAALPPTTQNAILIYLLRANTAMQMLAWKGCRPPGSSG
ncbi:MAG TPA: hypothetical protein VGN83_04975 [Falsiroseomonas sp.]|jgi:hypothetical protein|nr:hypothetical protein [Falsiroseomonas sp.]